MSKENEKIDNTFFKKNSNFLFRKNKIIFLKYLLNVFIILVTLKFIITFASVSRNFDKFIISFLSTIILIIPELFMFQKRISNFRFNKIMLTYVNILFLLTLFLPLVLLVAAIVYNFGSFISRDLWNMMFSCFHWLIVLEIYIFLFFKKIFNFDSHEQKGAEKYLIIYITVISLLPYLFYNNIFIEILNIF